MPFTSNDGHLPRRNARSFDLDDSAAKAAAWVWHLHTSKPGITTEGRFISSAQSRRRSSSNFDRKATRFQQEASTTTNAAHKKETPMWDCGSNLYDTFELVAFSNRLDRSLMEVVPITTPQAHPQEHHMRSPLHERSGILRTLSLPRSLSRQASKNHGAIATPNPNKFKLSKSYKNGPRASSSGSAQKASTKWSRMGKLMNAIKKMVVLHKQVNFVGCKRSTNIIESCQRPLDPIGERKGYMCTEGNQLLVNEKVRANFSTINSRDSSECMVDELPMQYTKIRSNFDTRSNYKLSIPSKGKSNYESNIGDRTSMQKKIRASDSCESLGSGLSMNAKIKANSGLAMSAKIRSNSESMSDGLLEQKKIRYRRKSVGDDELVCIDKGSNLGVNEKDIANEHVDHHKHLHHHHHHHHHHHYLLHNLASESARLSPETMSQICAEQSWLI